MRDTAVQGLSEIGESFDVDAPAGVLSVARRQIVAITRALTQGARLIVMDEPTSAITKDEVDHLFSVILRLKEAGVSILFVSHKLSELFEIAERVTVLRDGEKVGVYPAAELNDEELTYLMTGQRFNPTRYDFEKSRDAGPLLEVKNLTKAGQFENINFQIRSGEILGIAGLIGSGRTEVALSLFGMNRPDSGEIVLEGRSVRAKSAEQAKRLGIAYLPEDRLSEGLFVNQSIGDNIIVTIVRKLLSHVGLIRAPERARTEARWIAELRIKTPSARAAALSLSGGNQQRVVLAKWLATEPKLFILDGPTVGIDIGSKSNIHEIIRELARNGMAIIMISDEIPEILHNCNRILVMRKGRIVEEVSDVAGTSEDSLFETMAAESKEEAPGS
jgi:simple sugar transport system ATP-binding protein